jgi:hypothetical protein
MLVIILAFLHKYQYEKLVFRIMKSSYVATYPTQTLY